MNKDDFDDDAKYFEEFAANKAWLSVRNVLIDAGTPEYGLKAATVAALWRALEIAADGMSKEALKRMVFGDEPTVAQVLPGWKLVPEEPTKAMLRPFYECPPEELKLAYAAMLMISKRLNAAPEAPTQKESP